MDNFTVKLGSINPGVNSFNFKIKDPFFEAFTFSDIKHGNISAIATLIKDGENFSMNLSVDGQINQLNCDICTDDLSVDIFTAVLTDINANQSAGEPFVPIRSCKYSINESVTTSGI